MPTANPSRLVDRLKSSTARCRTVGELATAAFGSIARDVPFAFGCLATTDPLSGVITWAYKSHPLPMGDEEWSAVEYGEPDVNQFSEIARRPVPVGVLSHDTAGHPELCRRFREFLAPGFGFTDEVRVALGHRGLTWGALALYRGAGEPAFSPAEADRLAAVQQLLADAIRRVLFAGGSPDPADGAAGSGSAGSGSDAPLEPAVVIVDPVGRPQQMTRAARDRIDDLGGWDNGSLPAGVLAVAASARTADGMVVSRTPLESGRWLTLRGSVLSGSESEDDARWVVVTVELARPADLTGLTLAGRGLTTREHEIVDLILQGATTKAIAGTLHLSPHTVQDHLKAVFVKLGVNSRRELIAQLHR